MNIGGTCFLDIIHFFKQLEVNHINLTDEQKHSIMTNEGHHLLLACPGSGKTTVMVIKTAYLIEVLGIDPRRILTLTFCKSAALDMQRKYETIFGHNNHYVKFQTIHSFCYKLMSREFDSQGISRENIENKSQYMKHQIICKIYTRFLKKIPTEEAVDEVIHAISYIKNLYMKWHDEYTALFNIRFLKEVYQAYEEYKIKYNYYDYDDMLMISYQSLTTNKQLLNQIRSWYTHIQVDEAQDNSTLQNALIKQLVTNNTHLFLVADDDQAIYGWRGASHQDLLNFSNIYINGKIHKMERNFRSSHDIVWVSNVFISNNVDRYPKMLITQNPVLMPIEILKCNSKDHIYKNIIQHILTNNSQLSQYAFLYRNNLSSIFIAHTLYQNHLEFHVKGYRDLFFNHWIVKDILAFLLFAQTSQINYMEQIYYKNDVYLSKETFERAKNQINKSGQSIFTQLLNENLAIYQKKRLMKLKSQFKKLKVMPLSEAIRFIQVDMGYERWLKSNNNISGYEGFNHILQLLKALSNKIKSAIDFNAYLKELQSKIRTSIGVDNSNSITLSTVHSAKGLEFDTVFLVDLEQGTFPGHEALDNDALLEAERRLFYVGMTRAKKQLVLVNCSHKEENISQFINEVEIIINGNN